MAKAIALYRQAAERGSTPAQTYLGVIYDKGRGVPRDDAEAIKWYRLAANNGDAQSQFNLGVFLIQGRGTTKDENAGWDLVRKAAEKGYQPARSALLRAPN
jgi:TPR repeat protein